MREVKRSAIVVIPRQPMLDWLNLIDPDDDGLTLSEVQQDPAVYLIPAIQTPDDLADFLKEFSPEIFEQQLESWVEDDTLWPIDLSFETFSRWFAVSFHSEILDLTSEDLASEDLIPNE